MIKMRFIVLFVIALNIYAHGAPLEDDNLDEIKKEIKKRLGGVREQVKTDLETLREKTKSILHEASTLLSQTEEKARDKIVKGHEYYIKELFALKNKENADCIWDAVKTTNIVSVENMNAIKIFILDQSRLINKMVSKITESATKYLGVLQDIDDDIDKCEEYNCVLAEYLEVMEVDTYLRDNGFEASLNTMSDFAAYREYMHNFVENRETDFLTECDNLYGEAQIKCFPDN